MDIAKLPEMMADPIMDPFCRPLFQFYFEGNPVTSRGAYKESLQIIKQLRGLGFNVRIQEPTEKKRRGYFRAAQWAGATPTESNPDALKGMGTTWARDQWIKIEGKREKPGNFYIIKIVVSADSNKY